MRPCRRLALEQRREKVAPASCRPLSDCRLEAGATSHRSGASEIVALDVLRCGEVPGKLALYDDDGETFDYEKGEYSWTQLTAAKDAGGAWSGTVTPDANGRKWHYSDVKWTFMGAR